MTEEHADKEFVEYIIKHIVNNPDDVKITRKTDEMGVLIEVTVNPTDMGLLIGRAGTTAKAIRVLARIIGIRNNARVNLRIIEPEGSTFTRQSGGGHVSEPGAAPEAPSKMPDAPREPSMRTLDSDKDIDDVLSGLQS